MIGFKYNGRQEVVTKAVEQELTANGGKPLTAEQILKIRGMEMAWQAVHEYLNGAKYPLIRDKERDKWVANRLRKIKERYFDPI